MEAWLRAPCPLAPIALSVTTGAQGGSCAMPPAVFAFITQLVGRKDAPAEQPDDAPVDVGELYQQHATFLLRTVERLTGAGTHVEDIVQEAFLVAHSKRHQLPPNTDWRRWLYGVAANLVHHHQRSYARRNRLAEAVHAQQLLPVMPHPDEELDKRRQARFIRQVVLTLPLKEREVFVLYELECMEGKDVAVLLGVPENTVWTRLRRARESFQHACRRLQPPKEARP